MSLQVRRGDAVWAALLECTLLSLVLLISVEILTIVTVIADFSGSFSVLFLGKESLKLERWNHIL